MFFKNVGTLVVLILLGVITINPVHATDDDYDAIKITIENYFDGFRFSDRAKLERAFAVPHAHMKGYIAGKDGELVEVSRPMDEVIDDWVSRDPSPDFNGRILSINIFSDVAAQATFDFNGVFIDAFQLAKIDGEWRIMNKFYVNQ